MTVKQSAYCMASHLNQRADTADYLQIFLNDTPMMDVRAPVEANKGAFPGSENHPLLDNEQRRQVGIRYKQAGENAAIALGLKLATPEIRAQRYSDWKDFCARHPTGYLYCFRGGLRSRTTQQWLAEQGVDYPLILGGYKAMRRFLLDQLQQSLETIKFYSITGPTGSGKTRVLKQINHHVDFEGLAQHRGSSFGRNPGNTQPSNIDWENAVSIQLLKHYHHHPKAPLFIEDEGKLIGRVCMPMNIEAMCKTSSLVVLEESMDNRIEMTREDYIDKLWVDYQQHFDNSAEEQFRNFVLDSLTRIRRRLGGARFKTLHASFSDALKLFFDSGNSAGFNEGIGLLLSKYYDPMYAYQRSKRKGKVVFQGKQQELIEWANNIT